MTVLVRAGDPPLANARLSLRPRRAIEDGNFVSGAIQQLANDRLADFAGSAGNKKLHGKYLTSTSKGLMHFH